MFETFRTLTEALFKGHIKQVWICQREADLTGQLTMNSVYILLKKKLLMSHEWLKSSHWDLSKAAQRVNESSVFVSDASKLEYLPETRLHAIDLQELGFSSESRRSTETPE